MPFGPRGGRADALAGALRGAGHVVEQVWLPVDPDPAHRVERDLAVTLIDVSDAGEILIAVRGPAHLLRHPRRLVWLEPDEGPGIGADALSDVPAEIAALLR